MIKRILGVGLLAGVGVGLAAGCQSPKAGGPSAGAPAAEAHPATWASDKTGEQLWSQTCSRCHYSRPPQSYSAGQWDAVVTHMRLRANLTGEEQRKITAFLQASN